MWQLDHREGWAPKSLFYNCGAERLLRVPWIARRSNQSILKEISPEIHWKDWCWSCNTLTTWCEQLTHWKRPWCWERQSRRSGWQRTRWLDDTTNSMDMSLNKLREVVKDRKAGHAVVHGVAKSWTWLSNWTTDLIFFIFNWRIIALKYCVSFYDASTWISHRYTYHHCVSVPGTKPNSLKGFHNHLWAANLPLSTKDSSTVHTIEGI